MDIYSQLFAVKIAMFVWKDEINWKEAGDGPFKKNKCQDEIPQVLAPGQKR